MSDVSTLGRWRCWPVPTQTKMLTCIQRWWMLASPQATDGVEKAGGVTLDLGWYLASPFLPFCLTTVQRAFPRLERKVRNLWLVQGHLLTTAARPPFGYGPGPNLCASPDYYHNLQEDRRLLTSYLRDSPSSESRGLLWTEQLQPTGSSFNHNNSVAAHCS